MSACTRVQYVRQEEAVPLPDDLISQYEAHRRYGISRARLSEAVFHAFPGYLVERPHTRGVQGAMVRESDVVAFFVKPIFADGQGDGDS